MRRAGPEGQEEHAAAMRWDKMARDTRAFPVDPGKSHNAFVERGCVEQGSGTMLVGHAKSGG
ncbi:MAG: hypothetical protein PWP23_298 [Candidatus Sumerlaeota bacterium]|nr:hypothetical protein [Candidatus Sumerlaeota bacterium]